MGIVESVAIAAGLSWASGLRLYAVLFLAGLLSKLGYITLPPGLAVLTHPFVMTASGVMFSIEFLADKIPGLDSLWDAVHTFIRIPAGALLAAAALGEHDPAIVIAAGLLGGTLASGSHFTKAGSRALINTSLSLSATGRGIVRRRCVGGNGFVGGIRAPCSVSDRARDFRCYRDLVPA